VYTLAKGRTYKGDPWAIIASFSRQVKAVPNLLHRLEVPEVHDPRNGPNKATKLRRMPATINRDDVWPGQGGVNAHPANGNRRHGYWDKSTATDEQGCYARAQTDTTDRASSSCATVPRLPGEGKDVLAQNLSAYQRLPSGTCPSPQQYCTRWSCSVIEG
jgi:hypothetical protein